MINRYREVLPLEPLEPLSQSPQLQEDRSLYPSGPPAIIITVLKKGRKDRQPELNFFLRMDRRSIKKFKTFTNRWQ